MFEAGAWNLPGWHGWAIMASNEALGNYLGLQIASALPIAMERGRP